jgi:hypothetical protein
MTSGTPSAHINTAGIAHNIAIAHASADTEDERVPTLVEPPPETVDEVAAPAVSVLQSVVVPTGLQEPRMRAPGVGVTGGVTRASVGVGRSLLRERKIA